VPVRNATLVYGNLTWQGFGIDRYSASLTAERLATMTSGLWDGIRHHLLPLPIQQRLALADFSEGLRLAVSGGRGKVVLAPVVS
jgi:hypothetical protein